MKNKINLGLCTGNFWIKEKYDVNKAIKEIYDLGIKYIEITFGSLESFTNLNLTKESLDLLKKFKSRTIHAPCHPYPKNKETTNLLQRLKNLYDKIDARYIVFHPHYLNNFDILLKFDWNVCIENSRPGRGWNFNKLNELFKKYPQFDFVLDTCHAGEFSQEEINTLFTKFKNKIKYFHLSAAPQHQPLHLLKKEELSPFKEIINFGKLLIIELWEPNLETIKKELKFLRSKFG